MQRDIEGLESEESTESDEEESAGETCWISRPEHKFSKSVKTMFSDMIDRAKRTAAREVAADQDTAMRHVQSTRYDVTSGGGSPGWIRDQCLIKKKKRR